MHTGICLSLANGAVITICDTGETTAGLCHPQIGPPADDVRGDVIIGIVVELLQEPALAHHAQHAGTVGPGAVIGTDPRVG